MQTGLHTRDCTGQRGGLRHTASDGRYPRIRGKHRGTHRCQPETTNVGRTCPAQLREGEYIDSRIYSDRDIFEEELTKIWKKSWVAVCHESEIPQPFDFRTTTIAREPIIVTRGPDGQVRAFLNVCPHRGNTIENRPSGSFRDGTASGRAEAHDMHVSRLAVRHERQLRAHLA